MPLPDLVKRDALLAAVPNTHNAFTHMVQAMESVARNAGKRSIFGKDKGLDAFLKFRETVKLTLRAMSDDGLIDKSNCRTNAYPALCAAFDMFTDAYPNWPEAYEFASTYFRPPASDFEQLVADFDSWLKYLDEPTLLYKTRGGGPFKENS